MRILIFSHIRLFGESLANSLKDVDEVTHVTTCFQADILVDSITDFDPHIILIDFATECALNEAHAICDSFPEIPILAIALPEHPDNVISCAEAGLFGYVPLQASLKDLSASIHKVFKGECECHPKIVFSLLREIRQRQGQRQVNAVINKPLTYREREILRLTGKGLSNKMIARELDLSVATIKNHQHNIFAKLQIHSRQEAIAQLRNAPWIV